MIVSDDKYVHMEFHIKLINLHNFYYINQDFFFIRHIFS